ncbi:MAG: hypothetical protein AAGU75_13245 [Bacillota bacterium]
MDPCELTTLVSALAIAISKNTPDDDELIQIAIMIDYLSDSLDAIVAQRALIKKDNTVTPSPSVILE